MYLRVNDILKALPGCGTNVFYKGGDKEPDDPPPPPNTAVRAESVIDDLSGDGSERRRKLAASLLTQNWDQPVLSKKGLLGI